MQIIPLNNWTIGLLTYQPNRLSTSSTVVLCTLLTGRTEWRLSQVGRHNVPIGIDVVNDNAGRLRGTC